MSADFSPEQKRYLEGLVAGLSALRQKPPAADRRDPAGPDAEHLLAMARCEEAGKKLADQEKWKREDHPFDAYARLKQQARANGPPSPPDNFRWRFHGLFYVAPTQDSYMCRLRIPNGVLRAEQLAGIADLSERFGGGYAHVTTRANLQVREIAPRHAVAMIEGVQDLGLCSRGAGADNIRNVTGDATAGISRQALLDTRPFAREWHFHILNDRSLYGLPRKFNVAFDGGGEIATLEDTNDIGFQAVAAAAGGGIEAGVWFRLMLGGITGHQDLARDSGAILRPEEATEVADAVVRVFIREGDRSNRAKARLKYVLDAWGMEKFLAAVEARLGRTLLRAVPSAFDPRPPPQRLAHVGVHPQRQQGRYYIGVVLPVGKLLPDQMRGLAGLARQLGDGDIRFTVWQNLLISGIAEEEVEAAKARITALGLDWQASPVRAGLVACTGNGGCRLATSNTKDTAEQIVRHVDSRLRMDVPVNIHLTGCPNSCAQHYIGDIGLVGCRIVVNDEGDTVEGFHIVIGGGYGVDAGIGREVWRDVKVEDCPAAVEGLLRAYLDHRRDATESFRAFAQNRDVATLKHLACGGGG
jgi:ferredoxin-nitrite reductase